MKSVYSNTLKLNIPKIPPFSFGSIVKTSNADFVGSTYVSNPIFDKFWSKSEIEDTIYKNSIIRNLLKEFNLPIMVNINELQELKSGHLTNTCMVVSKVYDCLSPEIKVRIKFEDVILAAMYHDYGKVLIPKDILCKKGFLNAKERSIIEIHTLLGYELLKEKGFNNNVLNLIKYHHQNLNRNGYPVMESNSTKFSFDLELLCLADKYSALREKRSYKAQLTKCEAFEILAQEILKHNFSQDIYTALVKSV